MGASYTKEADHVVKREVERLQSCMYNHECNVQSIEATAKAQDASAQLLFQELTELQNTPGSNVSGTLEKTGVILNSTQTSLSKQVGALCESFSILDNCLQEIATHYSSETGSPQGHTENRNTGSQMSAVSKQGSQVDTPNSPSSNDILKKDAMSKDVDKDKEIRFLGMENKTVSSNNSELQRSFKRSEDKVTKLELIINTLQVFKEEENQVINEKYELEKRCITLQNENKSLNTEILRLMRKTDAMNSLQSELDRSEYDRKSLERTVEQIKRNINELEEEKRKVRERIKIGKSAVCDMTNIPESEC